jgi:hypothetical protein
MNPPFSNGVKHLLKAWEILENGEIVCLLNADNLNNLCTKERKLLNDIIQKNGSWENIGSVFSNAERKTNVDVALIHLKKQTILYEYDFDGLETEKDYKDELNIEGFGKNAIATNDIIESIVSQYNMSEKLLKESYVASKKLHDYVGNMFNINYDKTIVPLIDINRQIKELKNLYWGYIFERVHIANYLTSGFYKKFRQHIDLQGNVLFNKKNITEVVDMFMFNRATLLNNSIMEVFFELTLYHFGNYNYKEGWKSNSSYKINKHIVIPDAVEFWYGGFRTRYQKCSFLEDLDIILSYITGIPLDKKSSNGNMNIAHNVGGIVDSLEKGFQQLPSYPSMPCEPIESLFFNIKFYKKGTIHLIFKDVKHRDMLNRFVSKNKNWVPSNTNNGY